MKSKNTIPDLFVLGPPKSGTTAFVASLNEHPDIFVPSRKEPRFFDAHTFYDNEDDYLYKNIDEYLALYKSAEAGEKRYRVDGSVFNIYSMKSIRNILELSPHAKFIIILRDPLTATKSMFSQRMKQKLPRLREISRDFDTCWMKSKSRKHNINYPKGCRNKFLYRYDLLFSYERYLPDIMREINKDNLFIGSYLEFKENSELFYKQVFDFLQIDSSFKPSNKKKNPAYHRYPTLKERIMSASLRKVDLICKSAGFDVSRYPKLKSSLKLLGIKNNSMSIRLDAPVISSQSDEDIKQFFEKTYQYMKEIGIRY